MTDEQRTRIAEIKKILATVARSDGNGFVDGERACLDNFLEWRDVKWLMQLIADQERTIEWHEKKPNVLMETILNIRDED